MPVVLASPPFAPPIPGSAFRGIRQEWVTSDGRIYDLNDWTGGIVLDTRGVEGLHFPKVQTFSSTSRVLPGKRRRGWRIDDRQVFWPLQIWGESSDEFLARYRAFFDSIHPDKVGTWRVTVKEETRELDLTGKFDDAYAYDLDPVLEAWAPYGVTLEPATTPLWSGKVISRGPWSTESGIDFIDGDGAPPFHLSPHATFASASIANPGDVDAYATWTMGGPLTAMIVGVGADVITVPFNIAAGQTLAIDTDPRKVTALLDGVDVTALLGFQPVAPIPPGGMTQLAVTAAGAGSVSVSIRPQYLKAF